MTDTEITIKSRDGQNLNIPFHSFEIMDDFMIKHMIMDTNDTSHIYIDEDYIIIKSIIDSLRYKTLIIENDVNLKLMYYVCDKWCTPDWLIEAIDKEINMTRKFLSIEKFIDLLNNNTYKCTNCGVGFNKYNNKSGSCKTHRDRHTIPGSNNYRCCNKEEPCMIGYHCINMTDFSIMINAITYIDV
jgi:hypothetical protein